MYLLGEFWLGEGGWECCCAMTKGSGGEGGWLIGWFGGLQSWGAALCFVDGGGGRWEGGK